MKKIEDMVCDTVLRSIYKILEMQARQGACGSCEGAYLKVSD